MEVFVIKARMEQPKMRNFAEYINRRTEGSSDAGRWAATKIARGGFVITREGYILIFDASF